ncbi:MAG: yciF [Verrucomicrobia bacterium]|nr:yciF [Verrucomicrobiota bacterium]
MKLNSLDDLFRNELRLLYDAERQSMRALPLVAQHATNPELKAVFESHVEQTRVHVARLERIFEDLGEPARGRNCHALGGLIAEVEEWFAHESDPAIRDAGLVGKVQRIEHYEIAAYTSARTYARLLGQNDIEEILQATLHEEAVADVRLGELSHHLNVEAHLVDQR